MAKRWIAILVASSAIFAGCSSASSASTASAAVPHGWNTYVVGKAAISAPADWEVVRNYSCPNDVAVAPGAPGVLYLGPEAPGDCAPTPGAPAERVYVNPYIGQPLSSACSATVNGLRVYFGPCIGTDRPPITFYIIPTLGIAANGAAKTDTGPDRRAVARVLHTLRRR